MGKKRKKAKKEVKTRRLKSFEKQLSVTLKSKEYLEKELEKIKKKEIAQRKKIAKEKQAITLSLRAKRLRS